MCNMTSFLKLQGVLLNKRNIQRVEILPDLYRIVITPHTTTGWAAFGAGFMSSHNTRYEVRKDMHKQDYQTVSDWIKSLY
jgi:hypothetical protein